MEMKHYQLLYILLKLDLVIMAMKYLNLNSSNAKLCDNIFGLRSEDGKDLWIGDNEVKINGFNTNHHSCAYKHHLLIITLLYVLEAVEHPFFQMLSFYPRPVNLTINRMKSPLDGICFFDFFLFKVALLVFDCKNL